MKDTTVLSVNDVSKTFTLHLQGSLELPVLKDVNFSVDQGTCVVLGGDSGAGKSSVMKMVYGSYKADSGSIRVHSDEDTVDLVQASARTILSVRRNFMGYVSQFLRVVPRVSTLDIVAEPLITEGHEPEVAHDTARELLSRLSVPERMLSIPPATFSGGEQQRVNIARGFASQRPLLLLDEPTASLDAKNRDVVVEMIRERQETGTAILRIFHDQYVRDAVADFTLDVSAFSANAPREYQ